MATADRLLDVFHPSKFFPILESDNMATTDRLLDVFHPSNIGINKSHSLDYS